MDPGYLIKEIMVLIGCEEPDSVSFNYTILEISEISPQ